MNINVTFEGQSCTFPLPAGNDWAGLVEAVRGMFGVGGSQSRISYVDDDGDRITVTSDAEVHDAVRMARDVLNLDTLCLELEAPPAFVLEKKETEHAVTPATAAATAAAAPPSYGDAAMAGITMAGMGGIEKAPTMARTNTNTSTASDTDVRLLLHTCPVFIHRGGCGYKY